MKIMKHPYPVFEIYPIDSDTIKAWVEIDKTTRHMWRIRLKGIEGGEKDTPEGCVGLNILAGLIRDKYHMHAHFFCNVNSLDKYGRHVGDIQFEDGARLAEACLAFGHHWRRDRSGKETKNQPTEKE